MSDESITYDSFIVKGIAELIKQSHMQTESPWAEGVSTVGRPGLSLQ